MYNLVNISRRVAKGFWPRTSADVEELAAKQIEKLLSRDDVQALDSVVIPEDPTTSAYNALQIILDDLKPEGYKLFPWIVREVKKQVKQGNFAFAYRHFRDIVNMAID